MGYTLNGQSADIGEEPHEQGGTLYVPFEPVVEALGGSVRWDNDTKMASATIGKWTANFQIASDTADVNGTTVEFPAPSYIDQGKLYVPAAFFHNAYGYTVEANGTEVSISI